MIAAGPPRFWFTMAIALTAGFVVAYPINWLLVDRCLEHGMMTVRPTGKPVPHAAPAPASVFEIWSRRPATRCLQIRI